MNTRTQLITLTAFLLVLAGCASTSIKQSWKSPDYQGGPARKVAVVAVEERGDVRGALEVRFVRELRKRNQDALTSVDLLSLPDIKKDKEAAAARLIAAGADSVLIVRLVDEASYGRTVAYTPALYLPGTYGYGTFGWYDYFSGAYLSMTVVSSSSEQKLCLDSSLFDLKTSQRLGSVVTSTTVKENADRLAVADTLAARVVGELEKNGLVR
jgi:hypothetical protein